MPLFLTILYTHPSTNRSFEKKFQEKFIRYNTSHMDDLIAARLQIAISLGFHIVFACIGMTMPVLMAFSEWKWLRTGKQVYPDITKAWSKGVAIFFAA